MRQNCPDALVDSRTYSQMVEEQIPTTLGTYMEVAELHEVKPGYRYLVVPCARQPGLEMKFLLRLFGDREITLWYIAAAAFIIQCESTPPPREVF